MEYGTLDIRGGYRAKRSHCDWPLIVSLSYNLASTVFIMALLVVIAYRSGSNGSYQTTFHPSHSAIHPNSLFTAPTTDSTTEKDISSDLAFGNKVVLVTGGSMGIGYYTALAYARLGAKVVFCSRNVTHGKIAEGNLNADDEVKKNGGVIAYYMTDVQQQQQVRSLIFYITQTFGTLDIVVNNAGILGWLGTIDTIPDEYPRSVNDPFQTNFYGTYFVTQEAIAFWLKEGRSLGIIVNVASVEGLGGFPGSSLYSSSKHAIIGFTKAIAGEYYSGNNKKLRVRCNAVAPGSVSTPMVWDIAKYFYYHQQPWENDRILSSNSELWQNFNRELSKKLIGERIGQPWEIAPVILFLSSHYADFVSGSVFPVDNTLLSTSVKLWTS